MKSPIVKAALLVWISAFAVYFYGSYDRPLKSADQDRYDQWLEETELAFRAEEDPSHPVTVTFTSDGPKLKAHWELTTGDNPEDRHRVFRILQLIRHSKLFQREEAPDLEVSTPSPSLTVDDGKNHFVVEVTEEKVESDSQVQLLLKLFELYVTNDIPDGAESPTEQPPSGPESPKE